ncbi:MAG: AAA family ATPase [Thiomargarita sp.]|nr:AAA family ATPase [Thiomargarita sp.]
MDSIRIKNLRCLTDTGDIAIKPLTILVGANSTGKSTFLRVFPLLRQSVETKTSSPILWFAGNDSYVDFGSIKQAIRTSEESVCFRYKFEPVNGIPLLIFKKNPLSGYCIDDIIPLVIDGKLNVEIELIPDKANESQTKVSKLTINFNENNAVLIFDTNGKVIGFDINEHSFLNQLGKLAIKQVNRTAFIPIISDNTKNFQRNYIENLIKLLAYLYHPKTSLYVIQDILLEAINTKPKDFINKLKSIKNTPKVWQKNISKLTDSNEDTKLIRDISFACIIPSLLRFADEDISRFAKNVQYISPSRSVADRFHRTRDISVAEIDHNGENLPMYLYSLSSEQKQELNGWLKKYFNIELFIKNEGNHLEIMVTEQGKSSANNIADIGFGYSEILPVIVMLWSWVNKPVECPSIIAIEQPELHLHPQLQAKLADVLVQITKVRKEFFAKSRNIPLMIETHGEAIIDRIGQLIEDGEIDRDDIQVLLFEPDNDGIKVRVSQYDENGCLINWPYGFFTPNLD